MWKWSLDDDAFSDLDCDSLEFFPLSFHLAGFNMAQYTFKLRRTRAGIVDFA